MHFNICRGTTILSVSGLYLSHHSPLANRTNVVLINTEDTWVLMDTNSCFQLNLLLRLLVQHFIYFYSNIESAGILSILLFFALTGIVKMIISINILKCE